jgi:hypothetical protein
MTVLSDARLVASVLPDRDFVQMPEVTQNKFKLSVACRLHPAAERSQTGTTCRLCGAGTPGSGHLPLTADNGAGFNPHKDRGDGCDG